MAGRVYDIDVTPPATPVTTPPADTVAIDAFAAVHAPPEEAELSVTDEPEQTEAAPVIVAGSVFTVSTAVVTQPLPNE